MQAWLADNDRCMFYKLLDKALLYFEYGSGGSTYQANYRSNITKIYTVESDLQWINKLKTQLNSNKVVFYYNEMNTLPNTYGYPGPNSTHQQWINYSNCIRNVISDEQQKIDLVLIDGRFRVACCLKCFDVINSECLIAFDDFLNRKQYHIVLDYYDIVEQTTDKRMVILRKKTNILSIPKEIIEKYELICD